MGSFLGRFRTGSEMCVFGDVQGGFDTCGSIQRYGKVKY